MELDRESASAETALLSAKLSSQEFLSSERTATWILWKHPLAGRGKFISFIGTCQARGALLLAWRYESFSLVKKISFIIIVSLCSCSTPNVELIDNIDPDIVLVNLEDGDRAFIAELINKIDSCNPKFIGIDAWFVEEKDHFGDSLLEVALKNTDKEILGYQYEDWNKQVRSHKKFEQHTFNKGVTQSEVRNDLMSHFVPVIKHELGLTFEHMAFVIARKINSRVNVLCKVNESIPIKYTRTLDQFIHIEGSELEIKKHQSQLENKIILLGYLGPTDEDKHFTPIRTAIEYPENKPDTYGLVVIANEVRTLLDMK
ncbi:CHASE2 domain-containing protein [Marinoscillum sp. MHG1-6]|uniref:CHASE2 domain-containing protein n=1 Tax=Marinoscillum sp. MHG1-6 TaxID=2959627 RepID=UPI002157EC23|nr:CHASE2 domain-containing protein [Marinoscillum sp. MHG1-6]